MKEFDKIVVYLSALGLVFCAVCVAVVGYELTNVESRLAKVESNLRDRTLSTVGYEDLNEVNTIEEAKAANYLIRTKTYRISGANNAPTTDRDAYEQFISKPNIKVLEVNNTVDTDGRVTVIVYYITAKANNILE